MKKLTAEVARRDISHLKAFQKQPNIGLSLREETYLQALEIALPILEQQEVQCPKCGGTGQMDSGGTQSWGEPILIECDCQFEQQEVAASKFDNGFLCWEGDGEWFAVKCVSVNENEYRATLVDDGVTRGYPKSCYRFAEEIPVKQERERGEEE